MALMKYSRSVKTDCIKGEKQTGIYKITNPEGCIYIGKSINIQKRIKEYEYLHCKSQRKLYDSLCKYGVENHHFDLICPCYESKLEIYEEYFIKEYNTVNTEHGLNLRYGGGPGAMSEETKQKMSESKRGKFKGALNPMYGKKHSKETNEKRRQKMMLIIDDIREKARINSTGRVYSDAARKKTSERLKGHVVSEETKNKLRESRSKTIYQYSLDNVFVKEWESIKKAQISLNIYNIHQSLSGKFKQAGGFIWKYDKTEKENVPIKRPKNKPVLQFSIENEFIKEYSSISLAAKENNINPCDISQVCLGMGKTARGFIWKLKNQTNN